MLFFFPHPAAHVGLRTAPGSEMKSIDNFIIYFRCSHPTRWLTFLFYCSGSQAFILKWGKLCLSKPAQNICTFFFFCDAHSKRRSFLNKQCKEKNNKLWELLQITLSKSEDSEKKRRLHRAFQYLLRLSVLLLCTG